MKFAAKKDGAFILPLLIPAGLGFLVALFFLLRSPNFVAFVALIATLLLFYGIYYFWTNTYYEIKGEELHYNAAFFKGSVPIKKITQMEQSTYPTAGNRPALSFTGLTIFYSGGSEIYISPENTEDLIVALRAVNRKIKVKM